MEIVSITPENVTQHSFFCIRDVNSPAFFAKKKWFDEHYNEGLRLKILQDDDGRKIAFIEYVPAEFAWRPVNADGYMFIHCMFTYSNKDRNKGYAQWLVEDCETEAEKLGKHGVAVMTSKGSWITDKKLFLKLGYKKVDMQGRFELMVKSFNESGPVPTLIDWSQKLKEFSGWHLLYANQCPWHIKAVEALQKVASENGIVLNVQRLESAVDAQNAPSGFGVFALIRDGKLLEDHYISETRFKNILKKEL
ncbi:MAG: hypothetical protein KKA81_00675 [Bacteroidetes bacterium]|nr:hypothetical protein [Bacteroidota bacterium]